MSRLGRVSFQERGGPGFLGTGGGERAYSESTAREIDVEVSKILDDATGEVRSILLSRRGALEALAQRLIEKEVIDGRELRELLEQTIPGPRLVPASDAIGAAASADAEPVEAPRVAAGQG
jgi:cell division protease FtsH